MGLYASFNAWYRLVTATSNDREALNKLRQYSKVQSKIQPYLGMN